MMAFQDACFYRPPKALTFKSETYSYTTLRSLIKVVQENDPETIQVSLQDNVEVNSTRGPYTAKISGTQNEYAELFGVLTTSTVLRNVSFEGMQFAKVACEALAGFLRSSTGSVVAMSFSDVRFGDSAPTFIQALSANTSLLSLSLCNVYLSSALKFTSSNLVVIYVSNSRMTSTDTCVFLESLCQVESLESLHFSDHTGWDAKSSLALVLYIFFRVLVYLCFLK